LLKIRSRRENVFECELLVVFCAVLLRREAQADAGRWMRLLNWMSFMWREGVLA